MCLCMATTDNIGKSCINKKKLKNIELEHAFHEQKQKSDAD